MLDGKKRYISMFVSMLVIELSGYLTLVIELSSLNLIDIFQCLEYLVIELSSYLTCCMIRKDILFELPSLLDIFQYI
jgi:hypothetical protein